MRTSQKHALGGHAGSVDDQGSAHEGQEGAHGGHDLWAAREQGWQEYYYTRCMEQSIFESKTPQGCCKWAESTLPYMLRADMLAEGELQLELAWW